MKWKTSSEVMKQREDQGDKEWHTVTWNKRREKGVGFALERAGEMFTKTKCSKHVGDTHLKPLHVLGVLVTGMHLLVLGHHPQ